MDENKNNTDANELHHGLKFQDDNQDRKSDDFLDLMRQKEEEDFIKVMSDKYGLPYIDLKGVAPEPDALKRVKEDDAKKAELAAFKQIGNKLYVAMFNPENEATDQILKNLESHGLVLIKFVASHASLKHVWSRYIDIIEVVETQAGVLDLNSEVLKELLTHIKTLDDLRNTIISVANESKNYRISRIIELVISGALHFKVSDVHIEPEKEKVRFRYRIDGELTDICFVDLPTMRLINSRFKLLSGIKLSITKNAQDGRYSIVDNGIEIEVRVSVVPGNYGESFVMRLLDPRNIMANIESLGMSKSLYEIVQRAIEKPNGIILTTGPTGSGKTTTLYAFVSKLYTPEIKIITIEDPVEYHLAGIIQTQVEEEKGYTFLAGLRAAMRQDPDIIMVGEIRDQDTAKVAINAALTGHLVFSTLHTNNAAGTIPRLLELGANPGILASALSLSLAQRLVRKLCPLCKEKVETTEKQTKQITNIIGSIISNHKEEALGEIKAANSYTIFKANDIGCEKCNAGYKGRMGIFEAIVMDNDIVDLLSAQGILNERKIKEIAIKQGIPTMREDGIIKILKGETSYEEVASVVDLYEE
ncbi:MAG: type II/IV secretion system protein [Candidatus Pacebacteria bacterium]|nr:type II/IV secretion system protein [Candidatus Paceibacterota bacterium]